MKLPHKLCIENLSREHLLVLVNWMRLHRNSNPDERNIAFAIWDHESKKNLENGKRIAEKIKSIDIMTNRNEWFRSQEAFTRNANDFDRIQKFYDGHLKKSREVQEVTEGGEG